MLEYGFRFYATQKYFEVDKEYTISEVWGGKSDTVSLGVAEDISITLPRTSFKDVKVNYNIKNNIQAPINKGQEIGTLEIISNDEVVVTSNLVALEDIEAKGFFGRLWSRFVLWLYGLFGIS